MSKIRNPMYVQIRQSFPSRLEGKTLCLGGNTELKDLFEHLTVTNLETDDAQNLKYSDNTWDHVVSDQMLEHLPCPWQAVHEMHRVLKPNGYIICTTCSWNPIHPEPKDYYRFMPDGLTYLFKDFKDLRVESFGNRSLIAEDLKLAPSNPRNNEELFKNRRNIDNKFLQYNEETYPWLIWVIGRK